MIAFAPFARHFLHSLFLCLVYFVVHKISELKTDNSLATPKQLVSPKFDEGGSEGGKIKTAEARSAFAELVFKQRPRPALASPPRPLRHLGFRNHAATNAGQNGSAILRPLDARASYHPIRRQSLARQAPQTLGRPRLLHPRPQPPTRRATNRRPT